MVYPACLSLLRRQLVLVDSLCLLAVVLALKLIGAADNAKEIDHGITLIVKGIGSCHLIIFHQICLLRC